MAVINEDGSPDYVENETPDNVVSDQELREVEPKAENPVGTQTMQPEAAGDPSQMSMEEAFFQQMS